MPDAVAGFPADAVILALAVAYMALASIDGIWLHLIRYRLHQRPLSRREHGLHTIRSMLFPFQLAWVINLHAGGWWFFAGLAVCTADACLIAWDAAEETRSRDFQGGLPAGEAAFHTCLQALHAGVITAALCLRPPETWHPGADSSYPSGVPGMVLDMSLLGAISVAALHVLLGLLSSARSTTGRPSP